MNGIREEGIVVEACEGTAIVQIDRSQACAHCKARCMEQGGSMLAEAKNSARARTGDTVSLEFNPRAALTAVLVVFGIPLLALLLGTVLATLAAERTGYQGNSQLLGIGVGGVLFLLTFIPIRLYDRHIKKSGSCKITVVKILKKAEEK